MTVDDSIGKLQTEMTNLIQETNNHETMLNQMISAIKISIQKGLDEISNQSEEIGRLENQQKLLTQQITDTNSSLNNATNEKKELEDKIKEQSDKIDALTKSLKEKEIKIEKFKNEITENQNKLSKLKAERDKKIAEKEKLNGEITQNVSRVQEDLQQAREKQSQLVDEYKIWDYIKSKIEVPEIEIMAIITSTGKISTDSIKAKVKSVSPVFVGRAISKLEADGKIVEDALGNWNIAPYLLEAID